VSDPGRFADLAATNMNFRISDKDEVLQRLDVGQRLRFILNRLEREVARARVMEDVKRQTEIKIEQHQREFYLRQQLRAIQAELGETDPGEKEAVELLKRIDEAKLPERVGQEARRETERLRQLSPASSASNQLLCRKRTRAPLAAALAWARASASGLTSSAVTSASGRVCATATAIAPLPVPMSSRRAAPCGKRSSASSTISSVSGRGISTAGPTWKSRPKNSRSLTCTTRCW